MLCTESHRLLCLTPSFVLCVQAYIPLKNFENYNHIDDALCMSFDNFMVLLSNNRYLHNYIY